MEEALDKLLGARFAGDATAPLQKFLDGYANRPELAPKTREFYGHVKSHLAKLGSKPLIDVEWFDVTQTLDEIGGRGRTAQAARSMLASIFEENFACGMLPRNPMKAAKPVKYRRANKQRAFTMEEVGFLLEALHQPPFNRLEAMVILALTTSMGPAELYGLRRCDLNLGAGELTVNHNLIRPAENEYRAMLAPTKEEQRERPLALPEGTVAALREHLRREGKLLAEGDGSEFVFTSPDGHPIDHSNLSAKWWKPLLEKAAQIAREADPLFRFRTNMGMYALRHTAQAIGSRSGVGMDVIAERMGHASIETTKRHYFDAHALDRQRDAADRIGAYLTSLRRAQ